MCEIVGRGRLCASGKIGIHAVTISCDVDFKVLGYLEMLGVD